MKSFPIPVRLYLWVTYLAGFTIFISNLRHLELSSAWLFVFLCVLASLALILKVEGTNVRSHYTFSFVVYGFTFVVLGLNETVFVIVISSIVEWIWRRPPWFIQLFQMSAYLIAAEAAGIVYFWSNQISSSASWRDTLAIILGMATFAVLHHIMLGIFLWLTHAATFRKSAVLNFSPLMLEISLFYFGASLSIVWASNPYAILLFAIPAYLLYGALRIPALERKTEIDSKTGLFNHAYFRKQLENELARSNRYDRSLAVIIADLDLLRNINNTYGHLAGDEVLIGVAQAMKQAVREYDVVSRFGGEEFAILLTESTLQQAYERAESIRKTIEGMEFSVPTSTTPIRATMSFGVAHHENSWQLPDEIVHNADLALYHSKLSGRNRSVAYVNNGYIDIPGIRAESREHSVYINFYTPDTTVFLEYWVGSSSK
ncbi:MAG TPA: GGDEF domain-containing protein [Anaerolineales bacterium]|nr:GGDEF domain-containing protein [Anaerolineales bacterium]